MKITDETLESTSIRPLLCPGVDEPCPVHPVELVYAEITHPIRYILPHYPYCMFFFLS